MLEKTKRKHFARLLAWSSSEGFILFSLEFRGIHI